MLKHISQGCSQGELKAAYLAKVKQWHSDLIQHMAPELRLFADKQLGLINAAYDALKAGA
jgi:curved DNA-binding protein CbpA